jgi:hypothetical protein
MSQNLSLGGGVGVVFLTVILGGLVGIGLSAVLIPILKISNFEGGSGYFALSLTLLGLAGGFVVGLITALTMTAGFGAVLTRSASIVVALAVAVGIISTVAKQFEDKGPHLDGENIRLEVEYKSPPGWAPPSDPNHHGCWLQKYREEGTSDANPIVLGGISWASSGTPDETPGKPAGSPWTVSCVVPLQTTTRPRYLLIFTTDNKSVTMEIPLPRHPGPEFQEWSAWIAQGFIPQKSSPAQPDGFAFRFRVRKESAYAAGH